MHTITQEENEGKRIDMTPALLPPSTVTPASFDNLKLDHVTLCVTIHNTCDTVSPWR